jgi:putative ABC transport system ATP-binding protein
MPASDTNLIEIRDLRFAWDGGRVPVLDVPELILATGESLFLHGPSGCGKTTLLNLIGGVLEPQAGTIAVLGKNLAQLGGARRDALRAEQIGFVFQQFNLVPYLSVADNVTLPARFSAARRARVEMAGQSLAAASTRLLAQLGMQSAQDKSVTELSVGQQQRVALARALLGAPAIIIADEPTSALDTDRRDEFVELLFESAGQAGSSVVMVSHDQELGGRFDRVVDLREINRVGGPV